MKVNIDVTVEVSDEQRKAIAALVDGADAKKRDATRDELKTYIWTHGLYWDEDLANGGGSPEPDQGELSELDDIL